MVVVDASVLVLLFDPSAGQPRDRSNKIVPKAKERVEYLIDTLEKERTRIVVPTPALSEALIRADAAKVQRIVEALNGKAIISIEPFDQRAAIELAEIQREERAAAVAKKSLKPGPETWAKLKFDRQIVAIARVLGATAIYSDDEGIEALAKRSGIRPYRVCDLPLPPVDPQHEMFAGEVQGEPQASRETRRNRE